MTPNKPTAIDCAQVYKYGQFSVLCLLALNITNSVRQQGGFCALPSSAILSLRLSAGPVPYSFFTFLLLVVFLLTRFPS
ncbi:hypothetical protein BDZ91DRAFT_709581 [Kalaharituber pfeilii]|nr:hypothetical protein BDZ91DRAFT_709581 [Kalaharituber pfeilii]